MILYEVFLKYGMNPVEEGVMDRYGELWSQTWILAKSQEFRVRD